MLARLRNARGFSLIEMAIVLLIAGLLVGGAVQLTTNMQQQRADQATANEMRIVVTALERFINDQQGYLNGRLTTPNGFGSQLVNLGPPYSCSTAANTEECFRIDYLPSNISLADYQIAVRRLSDIDLGSGGTRPVFRGLVLRKATSGLNNARLSRIASLIGSQGGITLSTSSARGVLGSWEVVPQEYTSNMVNSALYPLAAYTTTIDAQINTNILSRVNTGNPEANTMRTDLDMGYNVASNSGALGMAYTSATEGQRCDATASSPTIIVYEGQTTLNEKNRLVLNPASNPQAAMALAKKLENALVFGNVTNPTASNDLLRCKLVSTSPIRWEWRKASSGGLGADRHYYDYSYPFCYGPFYGDETCSLPCYQNNLCPNGHLMDCRTNNYGYEIFITASGRFNTGKLFLYVEGKQVGSLSDHSGGVGMMSAPVPNGAQYCLELAGHYDSGWLAYEIR